MKGARSDDSAASSNLLTTAEVAEQTGLSVETLASGGAKERARGT